MHTDLDGKTNCEGWESKVEGEGGREVGRGRDGVKEGGREGEGKKTIASGATRPGGAPKSFNGRKGGREGRILRRVTRPDGAQRTF